MKRAVLVDCTNLFVIHYTANPALDPDGVPIGGVVGTLKALNNIVYSLKPDVLYVVWDGPGGSIKKRKILKEYKEGRKPIAGRFYEFKSPEDAKKNKIYQANLLEKFIDCLPVCQIKTDGYEADDAIAYVVNHADFFGNRSNIIISCDKDYYQLINEKTIIFNPMSKKLIDTQFVLENFDIHPKNWLFYRAINGDTSDNIKGVKGFGPKTIGKLFDLKSDKEIALGIIESVNSKLDDVDEKLHKKYKTLYESMELIERNWELMSLKSPLISIDDKDRLTKKIFEFKPSLDQKELYIRTMSIGGLGIVPSRFVQNFHPLIKK